MDTETIVKMIRAHHGGFEHADQGHCLAVWDALPEATRQAYIQQVKAAPAEPTRQGLTENQ